MDFQPLQEGCTRMDQERLTANLHAKAARPVLLHSLNSPPAPAHKPKAKVKYVRDLGLLDHLSQEEREWLAPVIRKYKFRANNYYLSLIDWDDPDDPIRQIVIPRAEELEAWGELDASHEIDYTVAPGCQHKYPHVALLLVNEVCGAYCRFCFRKRLFMDGNDEVVNDISPGLDYIRAHPKITNVLLTGGDPLLMSTRKLNHILSRIRDIPHVSIIRIGTKMLAFNPFRVLDDPTLCQAIERHSTRHKRIYLMLHFNHPRELTEEACLAIDRVVKAGAAVVNQTPLIRGVNDSPEVLGELFRRLSFIGVPPYYVFQCRPTAGNKPYDLKLARAFSIFQEARARVGGLAKRARFCMSHTTGKIEVLAMTDDSFFLRYHRAKNPEEESQLMVFPRDDDAYWFDDLVAARERELAEEDDTVVAL